MESFGRKLYPKEEINVNLTLTIDGFLYKGGSLYRRAHKNPDPSTLKYLTLWSTDATDIVTE